MRPEPAVSGMDDQIEGDATSRCPTLQSNDERKLVKVTAIKRIYPIRGFKHQTVRTTSGINISFKIHYLPLSNDSMEKVCFKVLENLNSFQNFLPSLAVK